MTITTPRTHELSLKRLTDKVLADELENLAAFEPINKPCEVCGATPVLAAVNLCGPCTFGESDTRNGAWWDESDAKYLEELRSETQRRGKSK